MYSSTSGSKSNLDRPVVHTPESIQKILDENHQLISAILENQNLGRIHECSQYQEKLQHNLLQLAKIADAVGGKSPPSPTIPITGFPSVNHPLKQRKLTKPTQASKQTQPNIQKAGPLSNFSLNTIPFHVNTPTIPPQNVIQPINLTSPVQTPITNVVTPLQSVPPKDSNLKKPKLNDGYWQSQEHEKFLEALKIHGSKDMRKLADYIGTRTPAQVRTHFQKYQAKLKKQGKTEETPKNIPETNTPNVSQVSTEQQAQQDQIWNHSMTNLQNGPNEITLGSATVVPSPIDLAFESLITKM